MAKIEIYGCSDDNVEVEEKEGTVAGCDEYGFGGDGWGYLVASDGSIVRVAYCPGDAECWKVELVKGVVANFTVTSPEPGDMDEYTERGTLEGDFSWVRWCGRHEGLAIRLAGAAVCQPDDLHAADLILTRLEESGWLYDFEGKEDETRALLVVVETLAEQAGGPSVH